MVRRLSLLAGVVLAGSLTLGALPATAAVPPVGLPAHSVATAVPLAKKKPRAVVTATFTVLESGKVRLAVASNAKRVQVKYRTAKNKKRTLNRTLKRGSRTVTLKKGSHSIKVRAKATPKLRASSWVRAIPAPQPPATPATWRNLAQSTSRTCGIDTSGRALCWGGGLGTLRKLAAVSTSAEFAPPVTGALAGRTVTRLAIGANHSCALDSVGLAYCWGSNVHGQLGDGRGNDTSAGTADPVAVDTTGSLAGKVLTDIAVGEWHTCALDSDGAAYCWGWNESGPLGNGEFGGLTYGDRTSPTPVVASGALAGKRLVSISAGLYHSCALDSEGTAYCWGGDMYGQVGQGKEGGLVGGPNFSEPVPVLATGALAGKRLTLIAAGGHTTCVLDDAGAAYCWGWNGSGQLGRGAPEEFSGSPQPVAFPPGTGPAKAVSIGFEHACALTQAGSVLCWGRGDHGALGTGLATNQSLPTPADTSGDLAGRTITSVSAGGYGSLLVDSDGIGYQTGARQAFAGAAPDSALTFHAITTAN